MDKPSYDLEAILAAVAGIQESAKRLNVRCGEQASTIAAMGQTIIQMQHRIDSPAAEAIDAVVELARMQNTHWLNIFHLNWSETIDESLAKILAQYRSILVQREHESDPHGSRNG